MKSVPLPSWAHQHKYCQTLCALLYYQVKITILEKNNRTWRPGQEQEEVMMTGFWMVCREQSFKTTESHWTNVTDNSVGLERAIENKCKTDQQRAQKTVKINVNMKINGENLSLIIRGIISCIDPFSQKNPFVIKYYCMLWQLFLQLTGIYGQPIFYTASSHVKNMLENFGTTVPVHAIPPALCPKSYWSYE